jgi:hypothetical protein
MTLSTLMYYTGVDPFSEKKVYVARSSEDKKRQKEYFFWYKTGTRSQSPGVSTEKGRKGDREKRRKR